VHIHYLQHVPFEDPAFILNWAQNKKHVISATRFYDTAWAAPSFAGVDWLIVMGGPMNVGDTHAYPWLTDEKKLIEVAINQGKTVIGICLGAQLIADVLGAEVYHNPDKEIGWFEVEMVDSQEKQSRMFQHFPDKFTAFHWHGDTFDIPPGAHHMMRSKGCENQAFQYHNRVFGFQFHLESTMESVQNLVFNCRADITAGSFVQSEEDILGNKKHFPVMHQMLGTFLDSLADT
jgi:GMP synthase-like glutamine amidotransferase